MEWVEKGKKPRYEPKIYTPLNAPLEEIFKEVEKRDDIRYPKTRGIQLDETKNHPEFYYYHQFRGHSTNDCREVKDIVQHLIRDAYLRKLVKQEVPAPDALVHQVRIARGTQFLCNTIIQSCITRHNDYIWDQELRQGFLREIDRGRKYLVWPGPRPWRRG